MTDEQSMRLAGLEPRTASLAMAAANAFIIFVCWPTNPCHVHALDSVCQSLRDLHDDGNGNRLTCENHEPEQSRIGDAFLRRSNRYRGGGGMRVHLESPLVNSFFFGEGDLD